MAHRTSNFVILLTATSLSFAHAAAAQSRAVQMRDVSVYSTHFEADGMRFMSPEELLVYLVSSPSEFTGVSIRECNAGAEARAVEAQRIVAEAIVKRHAELGEKVNAIQMGIRRIPCP